ncbi:hypothetical protein V1514DRAFT_334306 [Lipomyces japonicus]|uniref:uncharacterized protein n=1 Tax=Lipomyces japonicus TaxID=56871 RepID=UPI0034CEFE78
MSFYGPLFYPISRSNGNGAQYSSQHLSPTHSKSDSSVSQKSSSYSNTPDILPALSKSECLAYSSSTILPLHRRSTRGSGLSPQQEFETILVPDLNVLKDWKSSDNVHIDSSVFQISGYEVYLVEQWACARSDISAIICYTGNPTHHVTVGSISIPKNKEFWSKKVFHFMEQISKLYAREKPCEDMGTLFVTNLSAFPSNLSLVVVPDGDILKHQKEFVLNENLRRMGCGGRSAITLNKPPDASRDKFYQIFRISDKVPFEDAVIELVQVVQISLSYFGLFSLRHADGLLCDATLQAIAQWWKKIGMLHYNIDPNDKGMNPVTVAALIGMVVGCRHRLNSTGGPVPRDPFDVDTFRRSICHFQKQTKISKTGKLDKPTRDRLLRINGKISASERFTITKVVKTTVQDISGIQSQNAIDVETPDFDRFLENLYGNTLRYLWLGKGSKHKERFGRYGQLSKIEPKGRHGVATSAIAAASLASSAVAKPTFLPAKSLKNSSSDAEDTSVNIAGEAIDDQLIESDITGDGNDNNNDSESIPSGRESENGQVKAALIADEVPAFVKYRYRNRLEHTSRGDLRKVVRKGKTKTDEVLRSGVYRLKDNLLPLRRRQEANDKRMEYDSTLSPEMPLENLESAVPSNLDDKDIEYLETPEIIEPDQDDEDEDEDEGYQEDDEDDQDSKAALRKPRSGSLMARESGDDASSIVDINLDPEQKAENERLKAIEAEFLQLFRSAQQNDRSKFCVGVRLSRSCSNLKELSDATTSGDRITDQLTDAETRRLSFSDLEKSILTTDDTIDYSTEMVFRLLERVQKTEKWSIIQEQKTEAFKHHPIFPRF